jgi:hypothetical protein
MCKCKCKWFTFTWDLHAVYTTIDIYMHNSGFDQESHIAQCLWYISLWSHLDLLDFFFQFLKEGSTRSLITSLNVIANTKMFVNKIRWTSKEKIVIEND